MFAIAKHPFTCVCFSKTSFHLCLLQQNILSLVCPREKTSLFPKKFFMGAGDYHEDCPLQAQALEHLAHIWPTLVVLFGVVQEVWPC